MSATRLQDLAEAVLPVASPVRSGTSTGKVGDVDGMPAACAR